MLDIAELERRMRPGAWSEGGFLGRTESFSEVLERDDRTLVELGVTCDQLADDLSVLLDSYSLCAEQFWAEHFPPLLEQHREHLETVRKRVEARFGASQKPWSLGMRIGGRFEVNLSVFGGSQDCPWTAGNVPCAMANTEWRIRNIARDLELSGPGLLPHLIKEHRFFEGIESPYRVEPQALAELLELGPFAT